jgi:hypothetical protein
LPVVPLPALDGRFEHGVHSTTEGHLGVFLLILAVLGVVTSRGLERPLPVPSTVFKNRATNPSAWSAAPPGHDGHPPPTLIASPPTVQPPNKRSNLRCMQCM